MMIWCQRDSFQRPVRRSVLPNSIYPPFYHSFCFVQLMGKYRLEFRIKIFSRIILHLPNQGHISLPFFRESQCSKLWCLCGWCFCYASNRVHLELAWLFFWYLFNQKRHATIAFGKDFLPDKATKWSIYLIYLKNIRRTEQYLDDWVCNEFSSPLSNITCPYHQSELILKFSLRHKYNWSPYV